MIVQEGKYYKTRDGRKVGPIERGEQYSCGGPWYWKCDRWYFQNSGYSCRGNNGGDNHASEDLIAEWTDGPVRTVTRTVTEIVPGTYSGVIVGEPSIAVNLPVFMSLHDPSATELKAAAAVLLELAGALSDGE